MWTSIGVGWAWLLAAVVVGLLFIMIVVLDLAHEATFGPRVSRDWQIGFWTVVMLGLVSSTSLVFMRYIILGGYLVIILIVDHYSGLRR